MTLTGLFFSATGYDDQKWEKVQFNPKVESFKDFNDKVVGFEIKGTEYNDTVKASDYA